MSARVLRVEEGQYDSVSLPRVLRGTDREAATKVPHVSQAARNGLMYGLFVCSLLRGVAICAVYKWLAVVNRAKGNHRCTPIKSCTRCGTGWRESTNC